MGWVHRLSLGAPGPKRFRPRWTTLVLGVGVVLSAGAACSNGRSTPASCPSGTLGGQRLWARVEGRAVPVFDAASPPLGGVGSPRLNLPLSGEGASGGFPLAAVVEVDREDGSTCRAEVLWGAPPESSPGVAEARALREAGEVDAAIRAVETATTNASSWDRLWLGVESARNAAAANDPRLAKRRWLKAAEVAAELSLPSAVARRLLAASFFALKINDLTEALDLAERAGVEAESVGDARFIGLSRYHRGLVLQEIGDVHGASRAMRAALDAMEASANPEDLLAVVRALAVLYSKVGRAEDARKTMKTAANLFEGEATDTAWGELLNDWAVVLCSEDADPDETLLRRCRELQTEAIGVAEARDRRDDLQLFFTNLADYELRLGRPEAALEACARARALGRLSPYAASTLLINEALASMALGRLQVARSKLTQVLAQARRDSGGTPTESTWRALHGLGRVSERLDAADEAMAQYELALTERRLAALRSGLSDTRAPLLARGSGLVEDALRLALTLEKVEGAFAIAESAHAEVLRGLDADLRRSRLDAGQRAELLRRSEAYRRARAELEASAAEVEALEGRARYDAIRAYEERRRKLSEQFDDFFAWLDRVAPAPTLETVTVPEVQSLLAEDEAQLTLASLGDGYVAFLVTKATFAHQLVERLGHPLEPWGDQLEGVKHLYVAPGSHPIGRALHRARLPGSDDLVYSRFTVSYLPYAGLLRTPCRKPSGAPVVVADPEGNLPFAKTEGVRVAEQISGAALLVGGEVTRSALAKALAGTPLFHFAGHGTVIPAHPWDAHLRLANQERLTLEDVLMLQPRIGMAILNACETAAETELSDRESVALAGALLVLGTCTVVATDARVQDEAAAQFIRGFYDRDGLSEPADAVRKISLEQHRALRANGARQGAGVVEPWQLFRVLGRRNPE